MPKSHTSSEQVIDTTAVVETPVIPAVEAIPTGIPVSEATAGTVPLTPSPKHFEGDKLVMKATYTSLGMGFIPFPIIDILALSGFQLKMIAELSELHGVKFSEHTARNVVTALIGSLGPVIVGQFATSTLLKFVPGIGTAVAGLWIQGGINGATTYAVGRVFQRHFEQGGTFLDMDLKSAKEYFIIKFQEGKTIVAKSVGNATAAAANTFRSKGEPEVVVVTPAVPA